METSWSMIHAAAAGVERARDRFAAVYMPVVRKFLEARWRGTPLRDEVEDAVHEVFLDCLRAEGALKRADEELGSFRGFLFGVTRHVAQRKESEHARRLGHEHLTGSAVFRVASGEADLSSLFDREWAKAVLRSAFELQERHAVERNDAAAARRVDLLRLRFHEDLPIREIARRWGVETTWLHHQFEQSKREFQRAWREVMGLARVGTELFAAKWREFLRIFAPGGEPPAAGAAGSSAFRSET